MHLTDRQDWARSRILHWWNLCHDRFGIAEHARANPPTVLFSNRLVTTAGLASSRKGYVKLSLHFLYREEQASYDETIGHEVAHIFADRFYNVRCKHDWRWQEVMRKIGLPPARCHQHTSAIKRPRKPRLPYICPCGKGYSIGPTHLKRIKLGKRYACTVCRRQIILSAPPEIFTNPSNKVPIRGSIGCATTNGN